MSSCLKQQSLLCGIIIRNLISRDHLRWTPLALSASQESLSFLFLNTTYNIYTREIEVQ